MPESATAALLLLAALSASVAGMGWLALSMPVHAQQAGMAPLSPAARRALRIAGAVALLVALAFCLAVDHATMASLVWVMGLTAAAVGVAMTLAWRPRWLRVLVPWARWRTARG
ncbi:DUF3325 domain-containing protein [Pseudoxanthomonas sp. F37]|uniref:DUF3325 domain-containing protein n=1 Tax=Pseudoxanthomonas TaxID=83618 RepID=UPI001FD413E4|nr:MULTISPECIES: DUF3325 domain-containing protein [Pseudoxanthomonas]UOV03648.1 DUF3325 domain-containing protein [Pseudoxanthomonas mexicana]UOV08644.1 DUF3325 domain-containing protein [Pseudoxanthomonas sp. F37]